MSRMKLLCALSICALLVVGCGSGGSSTPSSVQQIVIVNNDPGFDTSVLPQWAAAFEDQINNDARPIWGGPLVIIKYYADPDTAPDSAWLVKIEDGPTDSACAGGGPADGCHNIDDSGNPYAEVDGQVGGPTLFSHEILEMWHDPMLDQCADVPGWGNSLEEIADPFASLYYIGTGGVAVNDFATPAWFGIGAGTAFDFQNIVDIHVSGPGQIPLDTDSRHEPLGFFYAGGC